MPRKALLALLLLVAFRTASAQVAIHGAVVTTSAGAAAPEPVPGAYVLARAGSPELVVAQAETDARGRYRLEGLPAGRVTLSVRAQGFYTLRAGELASESIARSCPQQGDCGETDFELARAAVIEGWLTDSYGDAYQDIALTLTPEGEDLQGDPSRIRARANSAASDDRGYFRMWDVRPGRYELSMRTFPMGPGGGLPLQLEPQTIEIAPGETLHEARIAIKTDNDVFSISGEVVGSGTGDQPGVALAVQPYDDSATSWTRFERLHEGRFSVSGLRRGEYVLRLMRSSANQREAAFLGQLTLDRDLTDLKLTPAPPTGIRGRIEFVDSPVSNLSFGIERGAKRTTDYFAAQEPDYEFQNTGLPPGEYTLVIVSPGYFLLEPAPVTVSLGQVRELTLRVSNQRAKVRGVARLAGAEGRQAAAHFTVGLRGERGRHKIQADDAGGFVFEKVIPGEYEIAAWESLDVDIADEEVWRRAGENRKQVVLEPGFETEISLTVTR